MDRASIAMAAAFRRSATELERSAAYIDTDAIDAAGAYQLALNAVAAAFAEVGNTLEFEAKNNGLANEEIVESDVADENGIDAFHPHQIPHAFDSGMGGLSKIHIPSVKNGKLVILFGQDGGNLAIEGTLLSNALVRNDPQSP